MDKVRFGIIGLGNQGGYYALQLFDAGKIENGVMTAGCDINPAKIEHIKKNANNRKVQYFNDYKEMLNSGICDAVIVATPHYLHPEISIHALEKGLHVICEKPAGVYTKQVKEMNAVASRSDKLFTMMYNQRTNPLYIKMHDLVHSGVIGDIRRVNWIITNWFRTQFYYDSGSWRATWAGEGGGILMNQCPHQLDLLQWICGMMPAKMRAFCHFGKWHDIEVEDDVTAYMEFENGATGAFVTCTADTPGTNRFEIIGSKGKIVCEKDELTVYRTGVELNEFIKTATGGFDEPKYEVEVIKQSGDNPQHVGIINNFANAILGIEPLYVDGQEGLKCVELIDSMLLSTWLDKTVTLPVDDELYWTEIQKRIATSKIKTSEDVLIDNSMSFGGTK